MDGLLVRTPIYSSRDIHIGLAVDAAAGSDSMPFYACIPIELGQEKEQARPPRRPDRARGAGRTIPASARSNPSTATAGPRQVLLSRALLGRRTLGSASDCR